MNPFIETEIWKFLPTKDIMKLCQVSSDLRLLCQNNYTWKFLLQRDFNKDYQGEDARSVYIKYKRILDYFTPVYPIITWQAVEIIYQFIPEELWDELIETRKMLGHTDEVLFTANITGLLFESGTGSVSWEDIDKHVESFYNSKDLGLEVDQNGCGYYLSLITKPTLVYVNKQLKTASFDYDLMNHISYNILIYCDNVRDIVENYYKTLI